MIDTPPRGGIKSVDPITKLSFDDSLVDLGKVIRGESREHTFTFTNIGTTDVEIDLVSSCECTTVDWPKGQVFKPGAKGEINIIFDSTEKEESETVDVDVILKNTDNNGNPIFYILQYKFELVDP